MMDYSKYENYHYDNVKALKLYKGINGQERSYHQHWHFYGEILLVGAGDSNIYRINQKTYEVGTGDILLVWPMEMHEIVDADRREALVIHFSNAFINTLFDLQRIMHFYRNFHVIYSKAHPELAAKLGEVAGRMREEYFSDKSGRELRCCMLLLDFMLILDMYRGEFAPEIIENADKACTGDIMQRMISVTDYIKNNLTADDLSQAAMADMAGISKDYFSRMFKNVTGTNYSKWLNMIRLEKATELLALNERSLTEVAMLSGFQSISSFNRVFRIEKGMTPSEYRALFTGGEDRKKNGSGYDPNYNV